MALSEARRRANDKYIAKAYDDVKLRVYKGQREQIAEYARKKGLSLNAYVMGLISADMGDKLTRPKKEPEQEQGE